MATTVVRTGPDAHPDGTPSSRTAGAVPSTPTLRVATCPDINPAPETATAWM